MFSRKCFLLYIPYASEVKMMKNGQFSNEAVLRTYDLPNFPPLLKLGIYFVHFFLNSKLNLIELPNIFVQITKYIFSHHWIYLFESPNIFEPFWELVSKPISRPPYSLFYRSASSVSSNKSVLDFVQNWRSYLDETNREHIWFKLYLNSSHCSQ